MEERERREGRGREGGGRYEEVGSEVWEARMKAVR